MDAYTTEKSIAEARSAFNELLDYVRAAAAGGEAHEVERGVFKRLIPLGLAAMRLYFAEKGTGDAGPEMVDPRTGETLKRERVRARDYFSLFGKFDVPRTCYRSPGQEGVFPLDAEANLPARCYSYLLQEWAAGIAVKDTFEETVNYMEKWFGYRLPKSAAEEMTRQSSADYDAYYEEKAPSSPAGEGEVVAASFDGKGVPMRKAEEAREKARLGKGEKRQKKREALVGVAYKVERKVRTPEGVAARLMSFETPEGEPRRDETPRAQEKRYLASLERPKEEVMEVIREDALARDPEGKRTRAVLADGSRGLWSLIALLFAGWTQVLDIIHVLEHLWKAAYAFHAEGSAAAREWVHARLLEILRGNVGRVIGGLRQSATKRKLHGVRLKTVEQVIGYLARNRAAMRYDLYLAAGLPIATGVVESACGHLVKNRMEGAGMRWTERGAEAVLLLRSVRASGDEEAYWAFHARRRKTILYQPFLSPEEERPAA